MNNQEYRESVKRTWKKGFRNLNQHELALGNASFGIAGEAGELADQFKKFFFHDVPLPIGKIKKELGDIRYYVTALEMLMGFTAEEVQEENSAKLKERYPEGFVNGGGIRKED